MKPVDALPVVEGRGFGDSTPAVTDDDADTMKDAPKQWFQMTEDGKPVRSAQKFTSWANRRSGYIVASRNAGTQTVTLTQDSGLGKKGTKADVPVVHVYMKYDPEAYETLQEKKSKKAEQQTPSDAATVEDDDYEREPVDGGA